MNDYMVLYETNLYSVPFQYVSRMVSIKDQKNGYIEFYDEMVSITPANLTNKTVEKLNFQPVIMGYTKWG